MIVTALVAGCPNTGSCPPSTLEAIAPGRYRLVDTRVWDRENGEYIIDEAQAAHWDGIELVIEDGQQGYIYSAIDEEMLAEVSTQGSGWD